VPGTVTPPDPSLPDADLTVPITRSSSLDHLGARSSGSGSAVGATVTDDEIDQLRPRKGKRIPTRKSPLRNLIEWVAVIGGALVVALIIRTFLIGAFWIPSGSMLPTLEIEDRVLVNKLSYRFGDPSRGDIIVFDRPSAATDATIKELIKRVIGLPGETIETRDGQVWINGAPLEEPWLRLEDTGCPGSETPSGIPAQVVPEGTVWVMGDNRCDSTDSRVFGPIDQDTIVGRAFVRIWPLDRAGGL
jgi:signal peptidase I